MILPVDQPARCDFTFMMSSRLLLWFCPLPSPKQPANPCLSKVWRTEPSRNIQNLFCPWYLLPSFAGQQTHIFQGFSKNRVTQEAHDIGLVSPHPLSCWPLPPQPRQKIHVFQTLQKQYLSGTSWGLVWTIAANFVKHFKDFKNEVCQEPHEDRVQASLFDAIFLTRFQKQSASHLMT